MKKRVLSVVFAFVISFALILSPAVMAGPVKAPVVQSCTPDTGPPEGNTSVTIIGKNFESGSTIDFGGVPALNVYFVSTTELTCSTPANPAGTVDVTVTNPSSGLSGTLAAAFTYDGAAPPPPPPDYPVKASWADPADGPHPAITGDVTLLKAIVESNSATLSYEWDTEYDGSTFAGDSGLVAVTDPYSLTYSTSYSAAGAYTAAVRVIDTAIGPDAVVGFDTYAVEVVDLPADPAARRDLQKRIAIEDGLWWLHEQFKRSVTPADQGSANVAEIDQYEEGTLFCIQAFIDAGFLATGDEDNPYTEDVRQVVNWITWWLGIMPITDKEELEGIDPENRDRGPVRLQDGLGVWFAADYETEYGFGPALKVLATCGYEREKPTAYRESINYSGDSKISIKNWSYQEIMQQMVDWISWAQLAGCGNYYSYTATVPPHKDCSQSLAPNAQGGWPYWVEGWGWDGTTGVYTERGDGFYGDASITNWTIIGLQAAMSEPHNLPVSADILPALDAFLLANINVDGIPFGPTVGRMVERGGIVLSLMDFLGWTAADHPAEVQNARDFITANWNNHNYTHGQDHLYTTDDCLADTIDGTPNCYSHFELDANEAGHYELVCDEFGCTNVWVVDFIYDELNLHGFNMITSGLTAMGIADVPAASPNSFVEIYADMLIENQFADGSWDDDGWVRGNEFGTAWAIQTLLKL